jgi:hypothetical protein
LAVVQEASPPEQLKPAVYQRIDKKKYNWGSAIVALRSDLRFEERRRVPLEKCYLAAVAADELPDSHPGACAIAGVLNAHGKHLFTAVSLYGQWEMMPGGKNMYACARLHRMMSDLTCVLAASRRYPIVLAGDFNVTTQFPSSKPTQAERDAAASASAAFARLRAWGLTNCLVRNGASNPRPAECTCLEGNACTHVQTFRSNTRLDRLPTQLDYAFLSESIAPTVKCRAVHDDAAWELSDHCPILLEFDEHALRGRKVAQRTGEHRMPPATLGDPKAPLLMRGR